MPVRASFGPFRSASGRVCTFRRREGARRGASFAAMLLTSCKGCGHELWSEVLASGAFRFVVHFDADERSATHARHLPSCPGCGAPLDLGMSEPAPEGYSPD